MEINMDIDKFTINSQRYEYQDGLRDFQVGVIILFLGLANWFIFTPFGLAFLAEFIVRYKSILVPVVIGFIALLFLLVFGAERVMERIRRATLWKESGFVKPLRWGVVPKPFIILGTAIILAIIIGNVWLMNQGTITQEAALRAVPISTGIGTAIMYFAMGRTLRIQRYLWVGLLGGFISGLFLFSSISFANTYLYVGVIWTGILLLSGAWALRKALLDLREGSGHE